MQAMQVLGTIAIAASLIAAVPAIAQDKSKERTAATKVLLENDKVRVAQTTFQPGDVSRAQRRARTSYTVAGGTLERTSKDGKKTVYERKAGEAVWLEADNDVVRNVGKTAVTVVTVQIK
jgi:hypothetical protein